MKNDKVDARKIALLYRFHELKATNIPDEDIECLRNLCRQYYKLNDELTAYKNRLTGTIDQLMLNFKNVFPDTCSKAAIAVLEKYPTPALIIKADKNKLVTLIQNNSHKGLEWATAKCELLVLKAIEFEPLSINNLANIAMLGIYFGIFTKKLLTLISWSCISSPFGRTSYTYIGEGLRLYLGIIRDTPGWISTYKQCSIIEQTINHFKENMCAANRKTQNALTIKSDLLLAGITYMI